MDTYPRDPKELHKLILDLEMHILLRTCRLAMASKIAAKHVNMTSDLPYMAVEIQLRFLIRSAKHLTDKLLNLLNVSVVIKWLITNTYKTAYSQ